MGAPLMIFAWKRRTKNLPKLWNKATKVSDPRLPDICRYLSFTHSKSRGNLILPCFPLEHGARTSQHGSALACALKTDKLGDVVEALVGGLNLNTKTAHDQSLLFIAACSGSKDTTACLIGKGADINISNAYGRTIIHQLITEGFDSMIEFFLLQPSLDLLHKDQMGRNVLHAAAEWGRSRYLTDLVNVRNDLPMIYFFISFNICC